jgi:hypothetical protein
MSQHNNHQNSHTVISNQFIALVAPKAIIRLWKQTEVLYIRQALSYFRKLFTAIQVDLAAKHGKCWVRICVETQVILASFVVFFSPYRQTPV